MTTETKKETGLNPFQVFGGQLIERKQEFMAALPSNITVDKFMRVVKTAAIQTPELLNADRPTLIMSALKAAQDGLLPDGRESAFVIFGGKVQYMPMVAGVLKKIRNSNELLSLSVHAVYKNDEFDYALGDDEYITHKPVFDDRGEFMCVYAIAKTKDGGIYREVMGKGDVDKVRKSSKSQNSPAWRDWYDEMAKKTVIRRLSKRLPMSTDVVEDSFSKDDTMQYENYNDGKNELQETVQDQIAEAINNKHKNVIDVTDISSEVVNDENPSEEPEVSSDVEKQAEALFESGSK